MINNARMISMLIDECKDNAGHEELSTCFRYTGYNGEIQERFFELTHLKDTDADAILEDGINPILDKMNNSATLVALGADGACVMNGCIQGVATQIKTNHPWVIYIH